MDFVGIQDGQDGPQEGLELIGQNVRMVPIARLED